MVPSWRMAQPSSGRSVSRRRVRGYRLLRERQVLEGLRAGLTTIPELVARIYVDVNPALHAWAGRSVAAHLLKLERERRVSRPAGAPDEGPWSLTAGGAG